MEEDVLVVMETLPGSQDENCGLNYRLDLWHMEGSAQSDGQVGTCANVLGLDQNVDSLDQVRSGEGVEEHMAEWVGEVSQGQACVGMEGADDKGNSAESMLAFGERWGVQAVAWNRHVPDVLLSGSFDHSIVLMDMRYPSHTGIRSAVTADVESLAWDPNDQNSFVVSLQDGTVQGFDVRGAASNPDSGCKPCFTLHAHDEAVTTVSFNTTAPKACLLATGSTDKMVKLWDLSNSQPSCVASNNPKAGAVFTISFSEESPFLLAIGGSKGKLHVWDTLSDPGVARRFGKYSNRKVDPAPEA
ncbi:hypothetical protein IFM89_030452 [Coptis chinensis]|uniref:Uncharacterized protein n=1 Tax=Coptis chinensis TaxID=261450 RepID=A0A835LG67_9MAGN|nr:hypothetical protein IFM89_030452 [Coptis chinensis]